jgi:hypothetical protein
VEYRLYRHIVKAVVLQPSLWQNWEKMTTGPYSQAYSQDSGNKLAHIYLFMTLFRHVLQDRNSTAFTIF